MFWLGAAVVAMIAVGVAETVLVNTNKAWWCRDGRIRRGGYTDDRWLVNDRNRK